MSKYTCILFYHISFVNKLDVIIKTKVELRNIIKVLLAITQMFRVWDMDILSIYINYWIRPSNVVDVCDKWNNVDTPVNQVMP